MQLADMSEDRAGEDEIEMAVVEGQMWDRGRGCEPERRTEVLHGPDDLARLNIDPPDPSALSVPGQPPDHLAVGAPELKHPVAEIPVKPRTIERREHRLDV